MAAQRQKTAETKMWSEAGIVANLISGALGWGWGSTGFRDWENFSAYDGDFLKIVGMKIFSWGIGVFRG